MFTEKESISVPNKSKSISDKSTSKKFISDKSKTNPRQVQDALIGNQYFLYSSHFKTSLAFLFLRFEIFSDYLVL